MVLNYSNSVSKVICIDLLNSSWEDIQNYFIISNSNEVLKSYIKHLYNTLHNNLFDTKNTHLLYIDDNYILGSRRHEDCFQKMSLGHTEILPDISVDNLDKSIFPLMEKILLKNKNLQFTEDLTFIFKHHFREQLTNKKYSTIFIDAHIELSSGLTVHYFELCKKYNLTIEFLDCVNKPDTTHFTLHKIYYKKQLPIIFVFKTLEGLDFMGWNMEYLIVLHNVSPINHISMDKKKTLNVILDKINHEGLSGLNSNELSFLDSYSKS
jgi:hypothetical protein